MTEEQVTNYYLLGCFVQFLYIVYITVTKKDANGNLKMVTMDAEAQKEGIHGVWPLFFFVGAMTIIFWPIWLIKKVWYVATKGIWK